jgi:uracil permease
MLYQWNLPACLASRFLFATGTGKGWSSAFRRGKMNQTDRISIGSVVLSLQHVFAMFGATVLVPFLTGLNPSVALFTAGMGTLIFHLITGRKVPVFLGSSFAFISVILIVKETFGLEYATGSMVAVGGVYIAMAALIRIVGVEKSVAFSRQLLRVPSLLSSG